MTMDMFMVGVFYAIGLGIGVILAVFGLYELYQEWKNKTGR